MNSNERIAQKLRLELRSLNALRSAATDAGMAELAAELGDRIDAIEVELRELTHEIEIAQEDIKQLDMRVDAIGRRQAAPVGAGGVVVVNAPTEPVSVNGFFPMGWR